MEVSFLISSTLEAIVSPCDLSTAIGLPRGARLLLRAPKPGTTMMVVSCDKPTASRLRRQFVRPRPYVHQGSLTSIVFVAMRPLLVAMARDHGDGGAVAAATWRARTASTTVVGTAATLPLSSRSPGVEVALDVIDSSESAGLHVPGIAKLYDEFLRVSGRGSSSFSYRRRSRLARRPARRTRAEIMNETDRCGETKQSAERYCEEKMSSPSDASRDSRGERLLGQRQRLLLVGNRSQGNNAAKERGAAQKARGLLAERRTTTYHHNRPATCVADVALSFKRLSREYSDAPRPVGYSGIISLLAKLYADGAAFAGNRHMDMKTLNRLGVVRWRAKAFAQTPAALAEAPLRPRESEAINRWHRILARAMGLVAKIVDFGIFLQLYIATSYRASSALVAKNTRSRNRVGRSARPSNLREHRQDCGIDSEFSPTSCAGHGQLSEGGGVFCPRKTERGLKGGRHAIWNNHTAGILGREKPIDSTDLSTNNSCDSRKNPQPPRQLQWLFGEDEGEAGRRAFNRHVVCGGATHGLIPVETAAAILQDAGKDLCVERVMRWWCERSIRRNDEKAENVRGESAAVLRGGRLIGFKDFVDMCETLKDHISDAPMMSPDDLDTASATVLVELSEGGGTPHSLE